MVATFSTLCHNLQTIRLCSVPRDPIITAAVSEFLLNTNRDALRQFHVDSPLTKEAREVIYRLPDLCRLWVVVEESTSLPAIVLPNLTEIDVEYHHNYDWLEGFRRAVFGRLNSVTFRPESESAQIADFLEAFESAGPAISTSLSAFRFYAFHPWRPNYRSLLSFTQLRELPRGTQSWPIIAQIYIPSVSTFEWIASMFCRQLLGPLTLGPLLHGRIVL
jgi:hypothetical protein